MKTILKAIWMKYTELLWWFLSPAVEIWEMLSEYVKREEERKDHG